MMSKRCFQCLYLFRQIFRYRVALSTLAVLFCLLYNCYQSCEPTSREFASISTSQTSVISTSFLKAEDLLNVLVKANGFLAATRTNRNKISSTGSSVCVVDPALSLCNNMGFAAFLLTTMDHIMLCGALGSNHPVVFWRACNSVCSRDPKVNSWDWYFEPVNRGLESQVERVFCPLVVMDYQNAFQSRPFLNSTGPILENSFKNRTDVEGFEHSKLITTQERTRINKLIQQYIKPNDRITQKVSVFYQQHLAGVTVLGVHVRGTDHWVETREKRLPSLMSWVKNAQAILETLPHPRKIFIASDNDEVIKKFVAFFGKETVVFTKALRARRYHGNVPPHDFTFEHNAADPYERVMGTQVLLDILLLAKCDHFLHAESSVASLATYFNPNMKSYFMDEKQVKEQRKVRERHLRISEARKQKQGDTEEPEETTEDESVESMNEILECLQRNSATSACPNAAKGKFVDLNEAQGFIKPDSYQVASLYSRCD